MFISFDILKQYDIKVQYILRCACLNTIGVNVQYVYRDICGSHFGFRYETEVNLAVGWPVLL